MTYIRFFAILTLLQGIFVSATAQPLSQSRQTSEYRYVYRITPDEARIVLRKGLRTGHRKMFHTLVDSVPTDSFSMQYKNPGHYLITNSLRNKQETDYLHVPTFDVKVLNNNTDLCLRVYDLQGRVLSGAILTINGQKLRWDENLQCFIENKSNRKGLVQVRYRGETSFFELKRKQNNPVLLRITRKVLYQTPLSYVWRPVRFALNLPVDGVKSLVKGWPQGTIRQTNNFFSNLFEHRYIRHSGYMVFDKPKYQPGDTVRFKTYIVNRKAVPVDKDLTVKLTGYGKNVNLTTLRPFRPGAFEYQFFIHDSLELKSDRHYSIVLQDAKSNRIFESSFRYEDYELTPLKLELNANKEMQFRAVPFSVKVRGTDENGLSLKDGRLEITLTNQRFMGSTAERLFIPNQLWKHHMPLLPTGETEIHIPDSIFPLGASLQYKMQVKLINSANQSVQQEKFLNFAEFKRSLKFSLEGDSVQLVYIEKEDEKQVPVSITGIDHFDNETSIGQFITPCRFPLNVFYQKYRATTADFQSELMVSQEDAQLQCYSHRTHDSLFVEINNPRNLHFNYHIYKHNREIESGSGRNLTLRKQIKGLDNYFVTFSYLWGGYTHSQTFKVAFQDKKLKVNLVHPGTIYPGQKATLEVQVTDAWNRPVEGVDLTAMSHTGKFDYQPPTLPYLGRRRPDKELINTFTAEALTAKDLPALPLNYEAWNTLASLDTIPLYQFLYPQNNIFIHEQKMHDGITQFAPFVVSNEGATQQILVVYLNKKPVYFGWNTNQQRYAFRVTPNHKHEIAIRTKDRLITLKNIEFREGYKTILSIPFGQEIPGVLVQKMPSKLSKDEARSLNRYIFPYKNHFDSPAFLKNDNFIQMLNGGTNKRNSNFAGPVMGELNLDVMNNYQMQFFHESGFQYEFSPKLIKMRELSAKRMPTAGSVYQFGTQPRLNDTVLTIRETDAIYRKYVETLRQNFNRYRYPFATQPGYGQLTFINSNKQHQPLNTVITGFGNEQFVRIYGRGNPVSHQMKEGYYQLVSLYADGYRATDSVWVQADGITIVNEDFDKPLVFDKAMDSVTQMIEDLVLRSNPDRSQIQQELNQMYTHIYTGNEYSGDGYIVSGQVVGDSTQEPIIGAILTVSGTRYGVVTDLNGLFSLKVPHEKNSISISFIGFKTEDMKVKAGDVLYIRLKESSLALEEVVVIGYGTTAKHSLTGSVTFSEQLSGRVAGLDVLSSEMRIRGVSSTNESRPIIIVDGKVLTGELSSIEHGDIASMNVLKSESAMSIYGSMAAGGAIVITTKMFSDAQKPEVEEAEFPDFSEMSSMRTNFSDMAFWQPRLITDKAGRAKFEVTFPDDITQWKSYVFAMNGQRQTGQTSVAIRSFKPLMAQLSVPAILTAGDTCYITGKTLNYTADTTNVTTTFRMDEQLLHQISTEVSSIHIDTVQIVMPSDSVRIQYRMERADGYFDGEERAIPARPAGLEEAHGRYMMLEGDTTVAATFIPEAGPVTLYAQSGFLPLLENEIEKLHRYQYWCNEQIASKLKALLAERTITLWKGESYKEKHEIEKCIRLLMKNRKEDGLWGWWPGTSTHWEFSVHILEALMQARNAGFRVSLNEEKLIREMIWKMDNLSSGKISEGIAILRILDLIHPGIKYPEYLSNLEEKADIKPLQKMQLALLKLQYAMPIELAFMESYHKQTMLGSSYYSGRSDNNRFIRNDLEFTILAYRLHQFAGSPDSVLQSIRRWFGESVQRPGGWNTFEAAQIINVLLPDLTKAQKDKPAQPKLQISGSIHKQINEYPFKTELSATNSIHISKTGNDVVWISTWQRRLNPNPPIRAEIFEIRTAFENNTLTQEAGKPVKLIVKLNVSQDAAYVMLHVPIPGGFSYADKPQSWSRNEHREYLRGETQLYFEYLPQGQYRYEISLVPRFTGTFTLNPARAELMYFPVLNGNNGVQRVRVISNAKPSDPE